MKKPMQTLVQLVPVAALALLAGCGGGNGSGPQASLAERCPSLKGKTVADGSVLIDDARLAAEAAPQPEYCVVTASFKGSTLRLEARLPTAGWNGKLAFLGGGGFDGMMPSASAAQFSESIFTERYATLGTNGGYDYPPPVGLDYFKGEFALDPAKLLDFTQQSEHRALQPGKEVLAQFFGASPTRSYFEGCSMGGHDALMQAQRFPQDFDGIVARAPAGNVMGLFMQFNRISRLVRDPAGALNPAKQTLLAHAVLAQCDGLDGLSDGILSKPAACQFDARQLRCSGGADSGDGCLSDAQIATVQAVTSPIATANGAWSHPGYSFGGEDSPKGWGEYIWPQAQRGGASTQGLFSDGFIRSFIARDAAFDTATWNPDQWLARMDTIGALFSATDPNLAPLHARGAKLILWNGTLDTSVSARDTARYYDQVVSTLGAKKADETVELFLAPGVGHCFGGPGPDKVDLLKAMSTWVEQGTPASAQKLVLRKVEASGATAMARPMCRYPAHPRYKGTGDANDAASFDCVN
ncbi:MAG: tannase/feruloyl esterase family alpha/beta hydrolase [Pseudomonadota bacterium]